MRLPPLLLALVALGLPAAAHAEDREFCADRPGLDTPPCTLAPGSVMLETGLFGLEHSAGGGMRDDTITTGDFLVRLGIAQSAEIGIGFGGFVHDRMRDAGGVSTVSGVGDLTLQLRRGLAGPNGPVALQAYVSLPTGRSGIGAGDWGAGVLLPLQAKLPGGFQLVATPEIDAAVNDTGNGRHLAYGSEFGVSHDLGKRASFTFEGQVLRDDDPAGHTTQARLAQSVAVQAGENLQFDLEADEGLNADTPDLAVKLGFAVRF